MTDSHMQLSLDFLTPGLLVSVHAMRDCIDVTMQFKPWSRSQCWFAREAEK